MSKLFNIFKKFHFTRDVEAVRGMLREAPDLKALVRTSEQGGVAMVGKVPSLHFSDALRAVDEPMLKKAMSKSVLPESFLNRVKLEAHGLPDSALSDIRSRGETLTKTLSHGDDEFARLGRQTAEAADPHALANTKTMKRLAKTLEKEKITEVKLVHSGQRLKVALVGVGVTALTAGALVGAVLKHMRDTSGCLLSHMDPATGQLVTYKLVHLSKDKSTDVYKACPKHILALLPEIMQPLRTVDFNDRACCYPKRCPPDEFLRQESLNEYKCWCSETSFHEALFDVLGNLPSAIFGAASSAIGAAGTVLRWLPRLVIGAAVLFIVLLLYMFYNRFKSDGSKGDGTVDRGGGGEGGGGDQQRLLTV